MKTSKLDPMMVQRYEKKGQNWISTVDLVMKKVQIGYHDGLSLWQKV